MTGRPPTPEEDQELRLLCPKLGADYRITSPPTRAYNCFAWAAHETHRQWVPCRHPARQEQYWPDVVPDDGTIKGAIVAYRTLGYEPCEDGSHESDHEKIALYAAEDDDLLHAARQRADGWWTSKLGELTDIGHRTPEEVESVDYGSIKLFLRRLLRPAE